METSQCEFEQGILRVGVIVLTPDTTVAKLEASYAESSDLFASKGQTSTSIVYTLAGTLSFAGVEMTVRCVFRCDRLEQVTLSPVSADGPDAYARSCAFLNALQGCADKTYPWGRVETHLFPDYHDDYHGGDVYITYF